MKCRNALIVYLEGTELAKCNFCCFFCCLRFIVRLRKFDFLISLQRTESKQLSSDDKKRPTYSAGEDDRTDEDENAGEENFYGNSDSDVGETEKESEGEKKDDKDDDSDEESENVRKVNENQRESGIGNHRNNSEDGKDDEDSAEDEEGHSEDSKSDELLGDEDDDKEQEMPLDLILGERDYINDNFLAKEGYQYNEDGLYDDVQEEDVFSKDENEPKNEDDFHHEDEDYYDNEEEVDEEEWTGTNLRNNNQNDLKEEEENGEIDCFYWLYVISCIKLIHAQSYFMLVLLFYIINIIIIIIIMYIYDTSSIIQWYELTVFQMHLYYRRSPLTP